MVFWCHRYHASLCCVCAAFSVFLLHRCIDAYRCPGRPLRALFSIVAVAALWHFVLVGLLMIFILCYCCSRCVAASCCMRNHRRNENKTQHDAPASTTNSSDKPPAKRRHCRAGAGHEATKKNKCDTPGFKLRSGHMLDNRCTAPAVDGSPHDYTQQHIISN